MMLQLEWVSCLVAAVMSPNNGRMNDDYMYCVCSCNRDTCRRYCVIVFSLSKFSGNNSKQQTHCDSRAVYITNSVFVCFAVMK